MADTEEVIGRTEDGRLIVYFENAGPSSYSSPGFDVSVSTLRGVEQVISIRNDGGYLGEAQSISGNTVTVKARYFDYDAVADGPAIEVADTTDLSAVTFSGVVIGH